MPRSLSIFLLGTSMLVTGCAFLAGQREVPVMSSPENTQLDKRITHLVQWRADDNAETFIAVLETHADKQQLVAVLPTGISLFSLDFSKNNTTLETSPLYSGNIKPLQLLAILQIVSYPLITITQQLPEQWQISETEQQRLLKYKNNTRITVQFTGTELAQPVIVKDIAQNQTLTITRLSMEDTP